MAHALRHFGKQCVLGKNTLLIQRCMQPASSTQAYDEMKDFWQRNKKLNRPLSPHLSIYKPQLTSMLSLGHRLTGILMGGAIPIVAAGLMITPGDFTSYLTMIQDLHLSRVTITACKYAIAFPFIYHYINGIRHLAWDWAKGFSLKDTYNTGYFVVALSIVVTACLIHLT